MRRTLVTVATIGLLLTAASAQAHTQDALAKIKSTQSITMGVREASGVMSFTLGNGKYTGFHVEICDAVLEQIKSDLELSKLDVKYQLVTPQNRIPLLKNGTVDVVCGTTTNNTVRQQEVAFAPTLYMEEVRAAVKKGSGISKLDQLAGKNVAVTTGSTSVTLLRKLDKEKGLNLNAMMTKDNAECVMLLESGRVDACVADGQILAAGISRLRAPEQFSLVEQPLSIEPIAIMFRKDSPEFKAAFDAKMKAMAASGEVAKLYEKWFMQPIAPHNRAINLPASAATKTAWAAPNDKPLEAYLAP